MHQEVLNRLKDRFGSLWQAALQIDADAKVDHQHSGGWLQRQVQSEKPDTRVVEFVRENTSIDLLTGQEL